MKLAFYVGPRKGLWKLVSVFVRFWSRGVYDHCEIVFSDGIWASSSLSDKGVRFVNKTSQADYDASHWHFVDLKGYDEVAARIWFINHQGAKFDVLGMLGFVFRLTRGSDNRWFCSEACAAALGHSKSWLFCPNLLHAAVSRDSWY